MVWVTALSIPFAITAAAFLHAARMPQWAWALSSHTQIWWLAGLAIGIPVFPVGIPAAIWYFVRLRPELNRIESGRID